jgi:hypothetical protein
MPAHPLYAVFRRDGVPNVEPVARWRVKRAALDYADACELEGVAVVVLYRDENPEWDEPTAWREIYRTQAG